MQTDILLPNSGNVASVAAGCTSGGLFSLGNTPLRVAVAVAHRLGPAVVQSRVGGYIDVLASRTVCDLYIFAGHISQS